MPSRRKQPFASPIRLRIAAAAGLVAWITAVPPAALAQWQFTDVTVSAGVDVIHGLNAITSAQRRTTGGAAAGDYNNDGWPDLYVLGGNTGQNHLFRNNGDGTFSDVAVAAGVDNPGTLGVGATFADWTGDGWLDLIVGGIETSFRRLYRNNGDGTFANVTTTAGVSIFSDTFSASFADIDNDDDLDLYLAHWNTPEGPGHIWLNDGDGTFTDGDSLVGYVGYSDASGVDYTFAANFADLNSDGWMDMVVASDFLTSHVFMNDGDGTFTNTTDTTVINDDNGMGTTVADFDKDGDLDWFVTSIYDGMPDHDGNRMYVNDGNGVFSDSTDAVGVRDGLWGWAATFQDLNNDGWLDIYHVNGWPTGSYFTDSSRCFVSDGDGTFTEMASSLGVAHVGQGRGACAFDYDRDGDLDLYVSCTGETTVLYRNDGGNANNWLQVKLVGPSPNTEEVGARITATVGGSSQMWELRCGNNFSSQDPTEAHFGLGGATTVDQLQIQWTDGTVSTFTDVAANQRLVLNRGAVDAPVVAPSASAGIELLGVAPNPSQAGTEIRFRLPRRESVIVRIYDAAGRTVRTVVDETRSAGAQSVTWDGTDGNGRAAASGIYYYEVRTAQERAQGRIARLR